MSSRSVPRARTALALLCGMALTVAACGSDEASSPASSAAPADTTAATTAATTAETTADTTATTEGSGDSGISDETGGKGAAKFAADLAAAGEKPLKAEGDPIVIGFQNPEGDPNGSFPEFSLAAEATVEYINNELGGLGADIANGKPGRPIQLEVCKMAIAPDDSQRCANELVR